MMKKESIYQTPPKDDDHSFEHTGRSLRKLLFQIDHWHIRSPSLQPPHYHSLVGTEYHQ